MDLMRETRRRIEKCTTREINAMASRICLPGSSTAHMDRGNRSGSATEKKGLSFRNNFNFDYSSVNLCVGMLDNMGHYSMIH